MKRMLNGMYFSSTDAKSYRCTDENISSKIYQKTFKLSFDWTEDNFKWAVTFKKGYLTYMRSEKVRASLRKSAVLNAHDQQFT